MRGAIAVCTAFSNRRLCIEADAAGTELYARATAGVLVAAFQGVLFGLAQDVEVVGGSQRHVIAVDLATDDIQVAAGRGKGDVASAMDVTAVGRFVMRGAGAASTAATDAKTQVDTATDAAFLRGGLIGVVTIVGGIRRLAGIEGFKATVLHVMTRLSHAVHALRPIDQAAAQAHVDACLTYLLRLRDIGAAYRRIDGDVLANDGGAGLAEHIAAGDVYVVACTHRHAALQAADGAAAVAGFVDGEAVLRAAVADQHAQAAVVHQAGVAGGFGLVFGVGILASVEGEVVTRSKHHILRCDDLRVGGGEVVARCHADAITAQHAADAGALADLGAAGVAAPFGIDGAEAFAAGAEEAEAAVFVVVRFGVQVVRVGEVDVVAGRQGQCVVGVHVGRLRGQIVASGDTHVATTDLGADGVGVADGVVGTAEVSTADKVVAGNQLHVAALDRADVEQVLRGLHAEVAGFEAGILARLKAAGVVELSPPFEAV